jgi:hypothetical protein
VNDGYEKYHTLKMSATVTPKTDYYKIGYVLPRGKVNTPPNPLCYQDLSCLTSNFSMCRYPNTHWQARVYYPKYQANCQCDKHLYKV